MGEPLHHRGDARSRGISSSPVVLQRLGTADPVPLLEKCICRESNPGHTKLGFVGNCVAEGLASADLGWDVSL